MVNYIKVEDIETCLNALFVLSGTQVSLEQLCEILSIDKALVIKFADQMIVEIIKKLKLPEYSTYETYRMERFARHLWEDWHREKRLEQQRLKDEENQQNKNTQGQSDNHDRPSNERDRKNDSKGTQQDQCRPKV